MADEAFYLPDREGRYHSTASTHSPWGPTTQHGGPPVALLIREIEGLAPAGGHLARVAVDFLRPVPVAPVQVRGGVLRGGRRVQLFEAELLSDDEPVLRLTAWWRRVAPGTVEDVPLATAPLPPPDGLEVMHPSSDYIAALNRGYIAAMELRFAAGGLDVPGPAQVWMRPRIPLLPVERPSPTQRVLLAVDSGSGIASALDFRTHLFINLDLVVSLLRLPVDGWVSLDGITAIDSAGGGVARTVIGDVAGPVGVSMQTLLVEPHAVTQ
ncbi:MAG: thioesterase family protein [Frankiaceae bacterium]